MAPPMLDPNNPPDASQWGGLHQYLDLKKVFNDAVRQEQWKRQNSSQSEQSSAKVAAINQGTYTPTYQDIGATPPSNPMPTADASGMASGQPATDQSIPAYPAGTIHPSTKLDEKSAVAKEKSSQFDQKQWSAFVKTNTPTLASSRSTLGMAANGNLRADRALVSIQNNPVMTNQDLGNVVGDLAGIYQGGAPTDMGMKHQQYDSIQNRIASLKQFITGKPQDAVPPAIKQKLVDLINNLKNVNNQAIDQHFAVQEKAQKKLIAKFPDEWQALRDQVKENYSGNSSSSSSTGNSDYDKYLQAIGAK